MRRFDIGLVLAAAIVTLPIQTPVYAQPCSGIVTVEPPNPTSATPVYLRFEGPGTDEECQLTTVEVVGTDVRVETYFDCLIGSFYSNRRQLVGALPPGNYTVTVHDLNLDTYSCGSFSVEAAANVPALSVSSQVVLLFFLAAVALYTTHGGGT